MSCCYRYQWIWHPPPWKVRNSLLLKSSFRLLFYPFLLIFISNSSFHDQIYSSIVTLLRLLSECLPFYPPLPRIRNSTYQSALTRSTTLLSLTPPFLDSWRSIREYWLGDRCSALIWIVCSSFRSCKVHVLPYEKSDFPLNHCFLRWSL